MTAGEVSVARELPRLDPLEVSSGMTFGPRRVHTAEVDLQPTEGPRPTLEKILLGALQRTPCIVAFSGGRDSSAILAETTRVARAHGLEDPIPHTLRFAQAPRAQEGEWQELMIGHLDLQNWSKRDVTDELDALGPLGLGVLRRHGVHWPPNAHTFQLLLEPAAGGSLVTGNGGDELFHPWPGNRIALLRRGRTVPRRHDLRPFILSLLPSGFLVRRSIRRGRFRLPWLTAAAASPVERNLATLAWNLERSWAESLEKHLHGRFLELGLAITRALADDAGVRLVEPFFDPRYVRSVYLEAPPEGYGTRTAAMDHLFGDLLPRQVASRSTKAVFTEVFCGPETRRFAEEWTGSGLDPSLVEPESLRKEWLSPVPDLRSLVPIQAARLASR